MALPWTLPVMGWDPAGFEIWMVPLRLDPVCCQVSVNEPEKGPLYCPDQVPPSAPVGAVVAVGAGVGVGVGAAATAAVVGVGVVVSVVLPQPATITATTADSSRPGTMIVIEA